MDEVTCPSRKVVLFLLQTLTLKDIFKLLKTEIEIQTDHKQIILGRLTGRCVQKGWRDEHKQQRRTVGIGSGSAKAPATAYSSHTTGCLC